ncbi:hypothetical protein PQJ75_29470 [Rhodoplanes sp. TEM]|uniref:Uncharacterized protein n=1 Tax=Rhodoplanes tepidamans TaxID=200616 RepID=A0ABT5JDN6_RHOTP|nr:MULTISPECIES: hypothetical protein [Rhodoplanes]MDC7787737.1 hypothetical protein [Rhodoplanes tepidamans]MDC7987883.1 hypothetical protein [Rhodoplanes sp. TEM]MDQ0356493.1 small-conductance mechanosensitive channel [Rhodoplanes tepidamans]
MRPVRRLWIGPAVALGLVAPLQFAAVTAVDVADPVAALTLFLALAAVVGASFALVAWRRWTAAAVRWTAVLLLTALLTIGSGLLAYAVLGEHTPFGRNIMLGIALFVDATILLPAAVVVLVHWLALRVPPAPAGPADTTRREGS